jgi:ABC-2 type transport system permease protein
MISWPLFKYNMRQNRTLWMIILAILAMYLLIIMTMFDPNMVDSLERMLELLPEGLVKAMGFESFGTTLLTFTANYIYGFLVFLFPMIYSVMVNHRLVAQHIDKGSMSYLLATPNTRRKIVLTQAAFSIFGVAALFVAATVIALVAAALMFPGAMEAGKFILLNLYTIAVYMAVGGIGFLAGCLLEERLSLAVGAGLPVMFLFFQMLGNAGDKIAWLGKFSLYYLFDFDRLFSPEQSVLPQVLALLAIALVTYGLAVLSFEKRDMHV